MSILKLTDAPPRSALNRVGGAIAFLLIAILGFLIFALLYVEVPRENQNALLVLVGVVAQQVGTVVNFFYGTSHENKAQSETINRLSARDGDAVTVKPGETVQASVEVTGEPR